MYERIKSHIGHTINCVSYGDKFENVAIECEDCCEVITDEDN